jgi:8-oxo-dGTP pyrophosphatase MutT (NUDIX family)
VGESEAQSIEQLTQNPRLLVPFLLEQPHQGDMILESGAPESGLTPAAVLVTFILRAGGATLLLTKRTDHLRDHPGQISFPGGRVEPEDLSPWHTAIREAWEEIGLQVQVPELLGYLPEYRTGTGFTVTPVVAVVAPPLELELDSFEVAEAFEVPLSFLLDASNYERHSLLVRGIQRPYYALRYKDYFIWGATAGMIVSLARRCGIVIC